MAARGQGLSWSLLAGSSAAAAAAAAAAAYALFSARAAYRSSHALCPPSAGPSFSLPPLANLGQTCYLNAVISAIAALPPLATYFDLAAASLPDDSLLLPVLAALASVLARIAPLSPGESSPSSAHPPARHSPARHSPARKLRSALAALVIALDEAFPALDVRRQQDPYELLHLLTRAVEEALDEAERTDRLRVVCEPATSSTPLAKVPRGAALCAFRASSDGDPPFFAYARLFAPLLPLRGLSLAKRFCGSCSRIASLAVSSFSDLSLPLAALGSGGTGSYHSRKPVSLASALDAYVAPQPVHGSSRCPHCTPPGSSKDSASSHGVMHEQIALSALPPVLALHFERVVATGGSVAKLHTRVDFPAVLDMAPYMHFSARAAPDAQTIYSLAAVIVHHGDRTSRGHYTAFRKIPAWSVPRAPRDTASNHPSTITPTGDVWMHVSDDVSFAVPEASVLTCTPSLLLYERQPISVIKTAVRTNNVLTA
ncbi:ubiquitin carboxyl-terminal hydrolase [Thecamonas trahens ATCC 50062]|uniref:ubiquitinyl hydrolase 1 n=1 Tax=Thecamonas trahens ATCC 50062 TaxID=461836 RepID=A0A0L0D4M4_THETB|nr:ubiquitin carboxyl-terminal hydrolase [Thecamonas trahens ATCC 50062]KNC47269.1 ubiquitin carboxyl-terminal hydrolase [Thecamonas trahens ATCC 50062]|eukprot:XP_013759612.1 ubiquitin carboxyl-terminal hydrolase [Thecamonas trahens ATCC 50062]